MNALGDNIPENEAGKKTIQGEVQVPTVTPGKVPSILCEMWHR